MGTRIPDIVQNPIVRYRLDPGEPGVARPTQAASSAITVTGQESRNRARLKAEALREGRQVVYVGTKYKVLKRGSFLTVVGGTTTVVTRQRAEPDAEEKILGQAAGDEVQLEVARLRSEKRRLEAERQTLERAVETANDAAALRDTQHLTEIERRLGEIRAALEELGFSEGISAGAPASPAGLAFAANAFNAAFEPTGQLLDLLI